MLRRHAAYAAILLTVGAAGCAHYVAKPLDVAPPLKGSVSTLDETLPPGPLSVSTIAALAVRNSPDLKAARAKRGVAQAQLVQAGVLPNPQLSGAVLPLISGVGTVTAWNIAVTQDIKSIVTLRGRRRGARFAAEQVDADLLWQEWQTAGKARQLAVDLIEGERSRPIIEQSLALLAQRNAVLQTALRQRNITLTTAAPTLAALQTVRTTVQTFEQKQLSLRHQLNALLGLDPEVVVPLSSSIDLPPLDPVVARTELATLADRRPDLLALRLGYASQDQALRTAILSQFPDLVLGLSSSSDNSKVINGGPQFQLGLPVFDRGQGLTTLAFATRDQLHAEYAARLAATAGEVGAALSEIEQLRQQLAIVQQDLPFAKAAADRAAAAFGQSNIDERSYVDLVTTYSAKQQEIIALQLGILDRQVALQTLLGDGLPTVDTLSVPPDLKRAAR